MNTLSLLTCDTCWCLVMKIDWERHRQWHLKQEKHTDRSCPDGGTCHHDCTRGCFRVEACGPLSDVYYNDAWPVEVIEANTPSDGHM